MKSLSFTAITVGTVIELHATGCRDLRKWSGDRTEIVTDSANAASDTVLGYETVKDGSLKLKTMPCCNERRMRAAGRVHEVADAPVAPETPAAEPTPEPTLEEALAAIEASVVWPEAVGE